MYWVLRKGEQNFIGCTEILAGSPHISGNRQIAFSKADSVAVSWDELPLTGRNIENTVPLLSPVVRLRTRIDPPCRATMPLLTQRPSPVPMSLLVVKKGSKILL